MNASYYRPNAKNKGVAIEEEKKGDNFAISLCKRGYTKKFLPFFGWW